ncbi:MAG: hypothetical protein L6Q99_05340 [Planctomycetes bacterium]|nr:hypothetical protein [Planctomycetota bacterium]
MTILACMLALAAFEVCDHCSPGKSDAELCTEHRAEEEGVLARQRPILETGNRDQRLAALLEIAALNEAHENAPSRATTRVLASGLSDSDSDVRAAAASALANHQHPEEAVSALDTRLRSVCRDVEKHAKAMQRALGDKDLGAREKAAFDGDALGLRERGLDRAALVEALGGFDSVRAEDAVLFVLREWELAAEIAARAGDPESDDQEDDPLHANALFRAATRMGTRRTVEPLCGLYAKLQAVRAQPAPTLSPIDPNKPKDFAKGVDSLRRSLQRAKETVLATKLEFALTDELDRFGAEAGFPAPPGDDRPSAEHGAWIKRHLTKLPPTRAPAQKSPPAK